MTYIIGAPIKYARPPTPIAAAPQRFAWVALLLACSSLPFLEKEFTWEGRGGRGEGRGERGEGRGGRRGEGGRGEGRGGEGRGGGGEGGRVFYWSAVTK